MFLLRCVAVLAFLSAEGNRVFRAHVGQSVDLPCVTPPTVISDWQHLYLQRPMGRGQPLVVFSFSEGREEPQYQNTRFQERTRFYQQNLTVSLSEVRPQDEGAYECIVLTKTAQGTSQLTHKEQLSLNVRADYQQPQIELLRGSAELALTCSAQDGYPEGHIDWKLNPPRADLRTRNEGGADRHPDTQLYNVWAWLNVSAVINGSASCCVVTSEAELCSNRLELTAPSGGGGQRPPNLLGIALGLLILAWSHCVTM